MNITEIKYFLLNPLSILKTFFYSCRYKSKIKASSKSKIKCSWRGGKLKIGEELNLGMMVGRVGEVGQISSDLTLIQIAKGGTLNIRNKFSLLAGARIIVGQGAKVNLGDGSFISKDTQIISLDRIDIGENCFISWDVQITDSDFHKIISNNANTKPIIIEDNVWIGSRATILKGVTIGEGAVVGSGAVVTRDVPARTLVVGNPAKVIRENVSWEK